MVTKANEVYMNENKKEMAAAFLSFFVAFVKCYTTSERKLKLILL